MGMGPHPDISPFPTNLPKRLEEQGQHDNHAITNGWISGGNDAKELVGCCAGSIESFQWGVRAVTRRQTMRPGRRARIAEPSQLRPERGFEFFYEGRNRVTLGFFAISVGGHWAAVRRRYQFMVWA